MTRNISSVLCCGLLILGGCHSSLDRVEAAGDPVATASAAPARPEFVLPEGTGIRVRLLETLDTKRNRAGDHFSATLDEPLVVGDRVVVPKGTRFQGHISEAKPSGRFKGRAVLALRLDSFSLDDRVYDIRSSNVARASAGHKRHHLLWIGGGSGGGALIGAAAGGGAGALIGAGAGAAAGTIGSAITGRRNVTLPVESTVRFTTRSPVTLGG